MLLQVQDFRFGCGSAALRCIADCQSPRRGSAALPSTGRDALPRIPFLPSLAQRGLQSASPLELEKSTARSVGTGAPGVDAE
jgi:hypothetical protein